ncbi:O-antigen ligase [Microbacterium sp. cf046]|uniref:O-antigen ligase family protein n=1 Tax=Microbacterium sp. cf046 TaxID=1761803 RepID=UPI0008E96D4D|nr:O-antigen ligase family protein [Microbacterium sp. cf046]SFR90880.1 O-antigen ligase [Microbacterium sp. cf046]
MVSSARARAVRTRLAEWWAAAWRWVLMAAGAALAVYLILDRGISNGVVTAAAIGVLVIGVVLTGSVPLAIPLLAMPALFVVQRVGFGGGDLTASDVALAAAFGTALLLGKRPYSAPMRRILWFNLLYQFATLFTVIVNPQIANTVEWFHAWLLISGALVVGWALGRAGYARTALLLIVGAGCVIAVGTVFTGLIHYLHGNFSAVYPTWPWQMHKNFAGTAMSFAAIIAYLRPSWARLPDEWMRRALWLLVVAILLTQSRQALVGLVAVILVAVGRRAVTGRSRLALLLIIPAAWLVASMIIDQINSQNQHNSVFQRLDWLREVYAFWKHSPIFGHGLRFWYYNDTVPYQPPQAELEVVASAGLVGLAAFVAMWVGILIVLWRIDPRYGTLAFALPLSRIVQGQFDLFWTSVQTSIPFVVAGICLGALALSQESAKTHFELREGATGMFPRARMSRRSAAAGPPR